jgi:hypothetical protein
MRTSSRKAKGRRCAQEAAMIIASELHLPPEDVRVTSSGSTGEDILLSSRARAIFNFAIECKNVEKLNIWNAIHQARTHVANPTQIPMVVFRKNNEELQVSLPFETFMEIYAQSRK